MVLAIIVLAGVVFLLFTFRDQVKGGLNKVFADKSPAELAQEKEEQGARDSKGAVGNTWDWFAGEGAWEKIWQTSADQAQIGAQDEQAQQQGAPLSDSDINPQQTEVKTSIPTVVNPQINPVEDVLKGFTDFFGGIGANIAGGFESLLQNQNTERFGGQQPQKPVVKTLLAQQVKTESVTPTTTKTELTRGQTRFGSQVGTSESSNIQSEAKTEEQEKFITTPQSFRSR